MRCTRSPLSGDNLSTFSIFNQVITFPSLNFSIPHSPPFQFYTLQSPTSCQVQDSSPFSSITSHFKLIAITLIFQFVLLTFPFNELSLLKNSFYPNFLAAVTRCTTRRAKATSSCRSIEPATTPRQDRWSTCDLFEAYMEIT